MFGSIFVRILWKEYRAQRGLWMAVLLLGIAAVAIFASLPVNTLKTLEVPPWGMIVLAICIGYLAGSSSILFGSEAEEGTFDLLKSWGVRAGVFLLGKLTFVTLSTVILAGLLSLFSYSTLRQDFLPFWFPESSSNALPLWMTFPGAVECLVLLLGLCVFLSLTTRRVLVSIAVALPSLWLIVDVPVLRLLAWMILVIDVVLVCRELGPKAGLGAVAAFRQELDFPTTEQAWISESDTTGTTWYMFKRLVWTDAHYVRWIVCGCLTAWAMLAALSIGRGELTSETQAALAVACTLTVMLLPAFVFHSERGLGRIHFHSERGADAGIFWLSKLAVWFPLLLIITMGFAVAALVFLPEWRSLGMDRVAFLRYCIASFLIFYSCGQLCSVWFRSAATAALVAVAVDTLLLVWLANANHLQIPEALSTWPLAVGMLTASRLVVGSWLDGALGSRLNRRPLAALGGSLVVMFSGVIVYRICEVPWFDRQHPVPSPQNVNVARTPTKEAFETRALYHKAFAEIRNPQAAWSTEDVAKDGLKHNRKAIELAHRASKRTHIAPEDGSFAIQNWQTFSYELDCLAGLILQAGLAEFREGALDSAFDFYLAAFHIARHLDQVAIGGRELRFSLRIEERAIACIKDWAVAPSQTTERVQEALQSLRHELSASYSPDAAIQNGKEFSESLIDNDRIPFNWRHFQMIEMMTVHLPWERYRSRQLVARITAEDRWRVNRLLDRLERRESLLPDVLAADQGWEIPTASAGTRFRTSTLAMTSSPIPGKFTGLERGEVERRDRRNAFLIIMALCAWRLEHGALPEDLESLRIPYFSTEVSSTTGNRNRGSLNQIPLDVWTGKPFAYFPSGTQHAFGDTGFSRDQPMLVSLGWLSAISSESKSLSARHAIPPPAKMPGCFPIPTQ